MEKGTISVVAENNGFLLKEGELVFHKPNEFHANSSTNEDAHNIIIVSFDTNSPSMHHFRNKIFALTSKQQKLMQSYIDDMEVAFSNLRLPNANIISNPLTDTVAFQSAILKLEQLLIDLLRSDNIVKKDKSEHTIAKNYVESSFVDSIKSYLKENIYKNISLQEICEQYNMSKSYICDLFRNETNRTIIDYYIDLKIDEAKYQIRKSDLNLTQVAEKLGYTSLHHFSHAFKSKVGMSPSEYKKSIKLSEHNFTQMQQSKKKQEIINNPTP